MNPYKRMNLISEDEYHMMHSKQPTPVTAATADQQAKLNNIAAQDVKNLRVVPIEQDLTTATEQHNDEKYLHEAPKVMQIDDDDETPKTSVESYKWDTIPKVIRSKAKLLMMYVCKYANVNDEHKLQLGNKVTIKGSNIFDLIQWAVKVVRAKSQQAPVGWTEFVNFLRINKAIPRQSLLNSMTIAEIGVHQYPQKAKLTPFTFESLYK